MLFQSSPAAKFIDDPEFGQIKLRRNANAKYLRIRMSNQGELSITLPRYASLRQAQDLLEGSRPDIRKWRQKFVSKIHLFEDGDRIGQSHTVRFSQIDGSSIKTRREGLNLIVEHPKTLFSSDPKVQTKLRPLIEKALQKEARSYLPRRLQYLAEQHGFKYSNIRFGTQKGRWGSCSQKSTISLNVSLMLLDLDLIDYVLIHELCHTRQMNHSPRFWEEVARYLPNHKELRRRIKNEAPLI